MKHLNETQRKTAQAYCRDYANKFFPVGSRAIIGLCSVSGSSVCTILKIMNCGAVVVMNNNTKEIIRLNPYLDSVMFYETYTNDLGTTKWYGDQPNGKEPFWNKESWCLDHYSGYTEDYDDTCETRNVTFVMQDDYKGHVIKTTAIKCELGTQINATASMPYENNKHYIFFNKTKDDVLAEIKADLDTMPVIVRQPLRGR